jgi:splicing factor 3B subunit 1
MLEDVLTDRDDLVHRQTASTIVKHLALGVAGLECEDSIMHLMNLVWPNCFETSPHVIGAVMDAIEAMRVTLGPGILLSYVLPVVISLGLSSDHSFSFRCIGESILTLGTQF